MTFNELSKKRYSCKKYEEKKVPSSVLNSILEAGRAAPTAKNLQEYHIYVIQSEEKLSLLDSVTPCRYNAPLVLLLTYDKNNVFTYPGGKRNSGIEDVSIVATHLMLASCDLGVDSCYLNNFDPEKVHEVFNLPENEEVVMMLDLGYAAEDAGPLKNHSLRKNLEETVTVL